MGEGRGPGNMQALSLIKARRCRPADEVWPHLALIRFQLPPAWPALAQPSRQRTTRPVHCTWGTWGHPPQPNSALHAQTPDRCLCVQTSTTVRETPDRPLLLGLGTAVLSWDTLFHDSSHPRNLQDCVAPNTGLFSCLTTGQTWNDQWCPADTCRRDPFVKQASWSWLTIVCALNVLTNGPHVKDLASVQHR